MAIGNIWLGSMQLETVAQSQNLATNSATFAMTSAVHSVPSVLDRVTIANSGAQASETAYLYLIPAAGTAYCSQIYNTSITGKASVFYQPSRPLFLYPNDTIVLKMSNAASAGAVYGTFLVLY